VSALQKAILEAGGERVRRAKARCDRASEAVESVIKAVTKARSDAKAAEKAGEKAAKAAAAAKEELIAAEALVKTLHSECKVRVLLGRAMMRRSKQAHLFRYHSRLMPLRDRRRRRKRSRSRPSATQQARTLLWPPPPSRPSR
jgi:phage-related tail protein